jgi:hypothetical protein
VSLSDCDRCGVPGVRHAEFIIALNLPSSVCEVRLVADLLGYSRSTLPTIGVASGAG